MYEKTLTSIAADPKLIGKLCELIGEMPNVDFPTMGGNVFWNTLAEASGWRLQQNKLTGHCRILDPNDTRKAWGSEIAMKNALNRLQPKKETVQRTQSKETVFCPSCGERVPNGRFCKECGSSME